MAVSIRLECLRGSRPEPSILEQSWDAMVVHVGDCPGNLRSDQALVVEDKAEVLALAGSQALSRWTRIELSRLQKTPDFNGAGVAVYTCLVVVLVISDRCGHSLRQTNGVGIN